MKLELDALHKELNSFIASDQHQGLCKPAHNFVSLPAAMKWVEVISRQHFKYDID